MFDIPTAILVGSAIISISLAAVAVQIFWLRVALVTISNQEPNRQWPYPTG